MISVKISPIWHFVCVFEWWDFIIFIFVAMHITVGILFINMHPAITIHTLSLSLSLTLSLTDTGSFSHSLSHSLIHSEVSDHKVLGVRCYNRQ